MSFRGDVEALSSKCETLERENSAMRHEVEPLRILAAEVVLTRDHNRELTDRMEVIRRKQASWILTGVGMGLIAGALCSAMFLWKVQRHEVGRRVAEYGALETELRMTRSELEQTRFALDLERNSPGTEAFAVHRTGTAIDVGGDTDIDEGDSCSVDVYDGGESHFTCRVEVRCGGRLVYGGGQLGYVDCAMVGRQPTTGRDHEGTGDHGGDPMLMLDLPGDRVVVADGAENTFAIEIALDAP